MDWEPFLEISQDPNARLDWQFDFSSLGDDFIDSYELIQDPAEGEAELTITEDLPDNQTIRLWVSNGVESKDFQVTIRITTNRGRVNDYTVVYQMRQQ